MKSTSRRRFLRHATLGGAALALPSLDLDRPSSRAQGPGQAERFVLFHLPNGVEMSDWMPDREGRGYTLPFQLEPLRAHRDDFSLVSGLSALAGKVGAEGLGGPHDLPANTFLACTPTARNQRTQGPSVDNLCGSLLSEQAPTSIANLFVRPFYKKGGTMHEVSFSSAGTEFHPETRPSLLFSRLFGEADAPDGELERLRSRRQSILDGVDGDLRDLRTQLGRVDHLRIDEYLDSVRSLERRLQSVGAATCDRPGFALEEGEARDAPDDNVTDRAELLMDLGVLALQCNLTRVFHFAIGHTINVYDMRELEAEVGERAGQDAHQISHLRGGSTTHDGASWYRLAVRWQLRFFARLLDRLKSTESGGQSLFDTSAIVMASEFSHGNVHNPYNLPVLVAGAGHEGGRHLHFPCAVPREEQGLGQPPHSSDWYRGDRAAGCADAGMTPISDLWLTVLQSLGTGVESFGTTSRGSLDLWP